jgi:hypothetical protein
MRERRTETGQLEVDADTGQVVKEILTLWGRPIPVQRKGKGKRKTKGNAKAKGKGKVG